MNLRNLFLQNVAQTSANPVSIQVKKAKGIYITDIDGKKYIDLISGISVSNLGHRNQAVIKAIRKQTSKYLHTMVYGEHIQFPQVRLAQLISSLLPPTLNSVYFTNSGAEAVEGAIKLAKKYTGRNKICALKNAYHGSTHGALSLMDNEYFTQAFRPLLPFVSYIDTSKITELNKIDKETACVIIEIVQSEAGYIPLSNDFLKALKERCNETGCLLVIDEIQTGMGRTGSMFAFEKTEITPDILLLAKGFGGGMPLGCFVAEVKIMKCLSENPVLGHITTFGGHPVSCAASIATFEEIISKKLFEKIERKEMLFRKFLNHHEIVNITGKGLLLGVHLKSEEKVFETVEKCKQNGLLIDWFLLNSSALRLAPPLVITEGEIKKVCNMILETFE
ncbi:MAG: aspartate aminotransferase family protein [Bacteroidetes bacterium]|nr:aspartate aminotransferase family protein [Bacteroidota bacterium]